MRATDDEPRALVGVPSSSFIAAGASCALVGPSRRRARG